MKKYVYSVIDKRSISLKEREKERERGRLQALVYDILFGGRCRKAMLGVRERERERGRGGWLMERG